ncbi:hypothetical protein AA0313_1393 [Acetobacter indonesiensis NRIC 0313]|nr:hypothetical protein AA0313_1393 [Acetobacter indonesiensis NRIC 0313]
MGVCVSAPKPDQAGVICIGRINVKNMSKNDGVRACLNNVRNATIKTDKRMLKNRGSCDR